MPPFQYARQSLESESSMKKVYWHSIVWRLAIALILALSLGLAHPSPAVAQSVEDYFQITYEPVSFSKTEIDGSEDFSATIAGLATCTKNLPVPVSEASITSRVVAEHTVNGTGVTLNPSYTITIKPFPSKTGDTTEINQVVPLKFPAQAESGDYNIIGKIIEAKVKIGFVWIDVSGLLPQDNPMGSLKYTGTGPVSTPAPTSAPESTLTPAPPARGIVWWVWLIVAAAGTTTVVNIIWFLRHCTRSTTAKQG